jgi:succinoglycan biosynthesis transport protein ExoP
VTVSPGGAVTYKTTPTGEIAGTPLEIAKAQLEELLKTLGPRHPDVRRAKEEIALLEAKEAVAASHAPPPPAATTKAAVPAASSPTRPAANLRDVMDIAQVNERISTLQAQISLTARELETHKADRERIVSEMTAYEARLARLPLREQEMAKVTRDYEMSKANYRSLLDKKFAAEMATDMEHRQKSERFTLLEAARAPVKPQKPNRPVLDAAASLMALGLGLALAIGLEYRRDVLLGEWELPEGLTVIARVPEIVIAPQPAKGSGSRLQTAARAGLRLSAAIAFFGTATASWYLWRGI